MRGNYHRALPRDFETHPVGTVKNLEAEIERLREFQKRDIAAARIRILEAEIERLRLEFYHYENENTYKGNSIRHWYDKAMAYGKSLDEANSEIERLQKQCDELADNCVRHGETIHAQELEIERLRAEKK